MSCYIYDILAVTQLIGTMHDAEKGVEKQVSLDGADDAAEVEKRIAGMLN